MIDMPSFDNRDGLIWYDGKMVPWREAKLHILTHALHYASSVFEGERAYNRVIYKLREHTERLICGAHTLGFEIPYKADEIDAACNAVCEVNGIVDGYIRPIAWRGSERMGISAQNSSIHLAISAWAWPSYFDPQMRKVGIKIDWSQWRRPDPATIPAKTKAAGLYMICTLAKHAAEVKGYQDALMLDWRGYIAETTGANIFIVMKDGKLHTPIPDCFLDGITRRTIIDLAQARGYEVVERVILPEELSDAVEVFLTGTAAEVTPVSMIGEHRFNPGKITLSLITDYDKEVRRIS